MKNNAKKTLSLIVCLALVLGALAGCTAHVNVTESGSTEKELTLSAPLNIGTLMGPTGMGMAGMKSDDISWLNVLVYDAPDQCMAGLLNGELDIAAIPSNVAAVLYNKTEGGVKLLGVNTGGVLYLLSSGVPAVSSLEELKGQTVLASGMGGVPEYAFKALMSEAGMAEDDVELVWMNSHADVVSTLLAEGGYALVPEPQVTVAQSKSESVEVCLDINAMWKDAFGYDLPMGVVACRTELAEQRPGDVQYFLNEYAKVLEGYNADKDAAAETIANAGILPSAGIAKKAMPRCNIMLETGFDAAKGILTPLYETLFAYNPQAVGGSIPEDDFYFTKDHEADHSIRLTF
ncbi:MAG: ABC transporter substrate-binding protein [Clostridia bacterium]|nr:ABC transporter substrate-binding protein [Clostridia bacterium]